MPKALNIMGRGIGYGNAIGITGSVQDNVTAAGTTQGDATPVHGENIIVTANTGTGGIILSGQFTSGDSIDIFNLSGGAVLVYPPLGCQINKAAVNAPFTLGAARFCCRVITRDDPTKFAVGAYA